MNKKNLNIQVLSDLHLEFHADKGLEFIENLPVSSPYLVLAGDICTHSMMKDVYERFSKKFDEIYFLLGNHEFYGSSFENVFKISAEIEKKLKNVHWLNRTVHTIEDQRILGCSLWFREQANNVLYENGLADFRAIDDFRNKVYVENNKDIDFLESNIQPGDIVVTHHLPSFQSVSLQFRESMLNRFFVCNLSHLIEEKSPQLWIHGHTHDGFDYMEGDTRIVCNPFGYPHEKKSQFVEGCVVDIMDKK